MSTLLLRRDARSARLCTPRQPIRMVGSVLAHSGCHAFPLLQCTVDCFTNGLLLIVQSGTSAVRCRFPYFVEPTRRDDFIYYVFRLVCLLVLFHVVALGVPEDRKNRSQQPTTNSYCTAACTENIFNGYAMAFVLLVAVFCLAPPPVCPFAARQNLFSVDD